MAKVKLSEQMMKGLQSAKAAAQAYDWDKEVASFGGVVGGRDAPKGKGARTFVVCG